MDPIKFNKKFEKFLSYMLDKNPWEFGLVPDENGYVKIKELIKAINEEEGWTHIKAGNINELISIIPKPPVEVNENLIRSLSHEKLEKPVFAESLPTEIHTCIRKKAHWNTTKRGINPSDSEFVILFKEKEAALKMGKRRDQSPVMLTIHTGKAEDFGVFFYKTGGDIFLARHIPPECFTGPPLPAPQDESRKKGKPQKKGPAKTQPISPDTFFEDAENPDKKHPKKDRDSWKENKKRMRKQKDRLSDPI